MPDFVVWKDITYRNCSKSSDSFSYYGFIPGRRGAYSLFSQWFNHCNGSKLMDILNEYIIVYVKDKEGIMNTDLTHIIDFDKYCKDCKYCDYPEEADPCYKCMEEPALRESHRPLYFKEKEKKEKTVEDKSTKN